MFVPPRLSRGEAPARVVPSGVMCPHWYCECGVQLRVSAGRVSGVEPVTCENSFSRGQRRILMASYELCLYAGITKPVLK